MLVKTLRYLLLILVVFCFAGAGPVVAGEPSDPGTECENARGAGLKCKACGDCAVILTTVGDKICKQWDGYEFKTADCGACSDSECVSSEEGFQ